jgi:thioredoxin
MKINLWVVAILSLMMSSCKAQEEKNLSAGKFQQTLLAVPGAILLDVRTPEEFSGGYLEGAKNMDYHARGFDKELLSLDKSKSYFVYCLSGGRSSAAAGLMRDNGFKNVYELDGGILAWKKAGYPLVTGSKIVADKISMSDYQSFLQKDSVVLIDFYAPWCVPCMEMEPMLDSLKKEYQGRVAIYRLNIDENKSLYDKLAVMEIPLFKLYRNGQEVWKHIGKVDKATLISKF